MASEKDAGREAIRYFSRINRELIEAKCTLPVWAHVTRAVTSVKRGIKSERKRGLSIVEPSTLE